MYGKYILRTEKEMSFIVAIDGPAGTGKGTMASRLSKKYNLVNIDTGATYSYTRNDEPKYWNG